MDSRNCMSIRLRTIRELVIELAGTKASSQGESLRCCENLSSLLVLIDPAGIDGKMPSRE
jgi:hypothetical protein